MLPESVIIKLDALRKRRDEIEVLLSQEDATNDINNFKALSKEFSEINPIIDHYDNYKIVIASIDDSKEIINTGDEDLKLLALEEIDTLNNDLNVVEKELKLMLLPKDKSDAGSAYLEIRAGAGGDEAAIFAAELLRLYLRLCERKKWKFEIISNKPSEPNGTKEAVLQVDGLNVYKSLKFESGVHRVQRVPETESQGRVHTSTVTVAVLPMQDEIEEKEIDKNELRVDTYRASGAGGQHVNKTDSAIRITHIPTGIVVECQDDRSQHKNKTKALSLLSAKLKAKELEEQQQNIANERKLLVGSGDRSEKIRTYNFPQGRVTDHRIKLTQHNLDNIMDGDLESILDALLTEHQLEQLSSLEENG